MATQRHAWGRAANLSRRSRQALAALAVVAGNPQLRRVAIARVASVTGRWASTIALAVFAYNTGGATYVGVLGVVRILPAALAGPLAAGLLDRVRADRLLLAAGIGRTLAIGVAGVALIGGADAAPVFVLVSVESLLSTMVRPLQTSALPFLARTPGELTAANLSLTTVESVGMLLGPALGGLLLTTWDPGGVLLVTAVAYLLSTLLIARIPAWQAVGPAGRPGPGAAFGGLRAIRADPRLRLVVGLYCAQNVVTGALNVLVVISALTILQLGESGVGELNAAIGVGGVVGAVAAVALLRRSRIASGFGIGLVLCGVPLVLIAAHPSTIPAILLLAVLGVGVTIVDFSAVTLLQRVIHEDALAKAFSVLQSLFVGSLGLGAALAPLLVSWLGIRGALLASGIVLPLLVAGLWGHLLRLDSSGLLADDAVNLLRSVSIFAPLELASLERLARTAVAVDVEAGRTIVAEGEIGDRYYVVRSRRARGERRRGAAAGAQGRRRVRRDRAAPRGAADGDGRRPERCQALRARP